MDFLIFVIALAFLIVGADMMITQSERMALRLNISEFMIGATLIALGTSLPEMGSSITATLYNKPQIALSNVIGSNILNITLILATIFLIAKKINPNRDFFAKDSTWALVPVFVLILILIDGIISRFDAVMLLLLMGAYLLFLFQDATHIPLEDIEVLSQKSFSWLKTVLLLLLGVALLIVGAHFMIESASDIAKSFGISDWVVGILMISLGTSLPELTISISAALKGKVDMAIGNIIGSNLANTTIVLGASALIKPMSLNASTYLFDIATMLIATLLLVFITANKLYTKSAGLSLLVLLGLFLNHTLMSL